MDDILLMPPALPALTGLRFLLALCVVIYHYGGPLAGNSPSPMANAIHAGFSTVSGFFVLSGFILAHNYLSMDGSMRGDRRAFWAARFARVYPVYAISILLVLPAYIGTGQATSPAEAVIAVGTSLVGLQAWVPHLAIAVNSAAWSLSVEAFFYFCFPWLTRLFRGDLSTKRLAWMLAACMGLGWIAPVALTAVASPSDSLIAAVRYNPLLHLPAFMAGMAAHRLWLRIKVPPSMRWATALLIALAFANSDRVTYEILNNGLLIGPFALLIAAVAGGSSWLSHPALVRLGEASYSLYILHLPAGAFLLPLATTALGFPPASWGYLLTILAGCVLLSLVAFSIVEEPYRKQLRRALQRRTAMPAASPAIAT